jgi:hypothetical protein
VSRQARDRRGPNEQVCAAALSGPQTKDPALPGDTCSGCVIADAALARTAFRLGGSRTSQIERVARVARGAADARRAAPRAKRRARRAKVVIWARRPLPAPRKPAWPRRTPEALAGGRRLLRYPEADRGRMGQRRERSGASRSERRYTGHRGDGRGWRVVAPSRLVLSERFHVPWTQRTAVDGRKTHQVAVAIEQFRRRSITDLELLRSRESRPESRANTRSALFGSHDNRGF